MSFFFWFLCHLQRTPAEVYAVLLYAGTENIFGSFPSLAIGLSLQELRVVTHKSDETLSTPG